MTASKYSDPSFLCCSVTSNSSYAMHKLVRAWSFDRSNIGPKAKFCKAALDFLTFVVKFVAKEPNRGARMVSHIETCFSEACEVYAESDLDKVAIVERLELLSNFLYDSGGSNGGYELYSFIHDHYRRGDYTNSGGYYASVINIGNTMLVRGRDKEAAELL